MKRARAALLLAGALACRRGHPTGAAPSNGAAAAVAAGDSLYARERDDSAQTILTGALVLARSTGDVRSEARALTSLGTVTWRAGDLPRARQLTEEALALKIKHGFADDYFESYNTLGLISSDEGHDSAAVHLFTQALQVARAAHDTVNIVRAIGNIGKSDTYLGDYQAARVSQREARSEARDIRSRRLEANALANEAMIDIYEGDPQPAIARLDSARAIYAGTYATGDQNLLSQLATAYELIGEEGRAFAALDTAIALAHRLHLSEREGEDLRLLGGLHFRVGDYRRAVRYFERARPGLLAKGFEDDLANTLRGLAEAHLRLDDVRQAETDAEGALRLHIADGGRLEQLDDQLLLAAIEFRTGGLPQAELRLRAGYVLADRLNTRSARIAVALAEARLADEARDAPRVLRALRGVGPDIQAGAFGADWEVAALEARAFARLGSLDSAAALGRRAVSAVERLRADIASPEIRGTLVADRAEVYADLVVVLLRQGNTTEAFSVADEARSQELLEQLAYARNSAQVGALPRTLVDADLLLRRIDSLVVRMRETAPSRRPQRGEVWDSLNAGLAAELDTARAAYEALLIRAAQEHPRTAGVLRGHTHSPRDIRARIQPGEVLLDYLLTNDQLIVFVLSSAKLDVIHQPFSPQSLTARISLLRDLWGSPTPNWRWGLRAARALHQTLIGPVLDAGLLRGVTRLLIVPHGTLGQVPFAALVDSATGHYLVQDYSILELPSASSLPALRSFLPQTAWDGSAEGLAPFPADLQSTTPEVNTLRQALPKAVIRIGADASERELRRALTTRQLVHVATHGVVNAQNPMFSRVELAAPSVETPDNDGRLEVHEVLGLEVRSPLVFLSGCETGGVEEWTSDPVRGTGELTLAQAFLAAGADNVVLTLWRIDDAGAAALASHFYTRLLSAQPAEALAAAQRDVLRNSSFASPYYWAGYVVSGSGDLRTKPF